ncbi:hypothetical protein AY599_27915 [Leptolyngbya valderiana BDU 20041]|nr:hypothetical protein AY599_27915 [Leptolyngbya valderiana BDU 20041]
MKLPKSLNFSLKLLCITVIVLGIFYRVTNLGLKFYWGDEVRTSMRISGYTEEEVIETSYTGEILEFSQLQHYHYPQNRTVSDTLSALAHHPEHPPLYYLSARFWVQFWMQWFSDSVAVTRSLSALFSLLAIPCAFWLCRELFADSRVAWVATALVAISPLHILYAHEARQYSLWVLAILFSSGMLVRSLRRFTVKNWGIYAFSIALGLYSHLLFALVAIAHGIYVFATEGIRRSKTVISYLVSSIFGWLLFSPWIWIIVTKTARTSEAIEEGESSVEFSFLVYRWFRNLNRVFFNANLGDINFILVLFVLYALYILIRETPRKTWLLVLTIVATNAIFLVIPDIFWGSRRSAGLRYLFASYTGIQIAVAYLFSTKFNSVKLWQQKTWRVVFVLFLTVGTIMGAIDLQKEVTWNKSDDKARFYIPAADNINLAPNPLLITTEDPVKVLTFSYRVKPETQFQLFREERLPDFPENRSVFLFNPSPVLQQQVQALPNTQLELVENRKDELKLWQVLR